MRELAETGWMSNRGRQNVASFLVKDLHLPWTWGARFFLHHLLDGDLASNNHGWQWAAGTGTDAAPFLRNSPALSRSTPDVGLMLRNGSAELTAFTHMGPPATPGKSF